MYELRKWRYLIFLTFLNSASASGVPVNAPFVETIVFWILFHSFFFLALFSFRMKDFFEGIQVFSLGRKLFL